MLQQISLRIGFLASAIALFIGTMHQYTHPTAAHVFASPNIVISQIYGAGGNSGATWRNDFIELFNRGPAAVNLVGWSMQ